MIYNITHVTRYTYGATVELTNGVLRLTPVSRDGQVLERFSLEHGAALPAVRPERIDAFGNTVMSLSIEKPHRELSITAKSRVRVDRPAGPSDLRRRGRASPQKRLWSNRSPSDSPAIALYPSRALSLFDEATAYARESFTERRPVYEAAMESDATDPCRFRLRPRARRK